MNSLMHPTELVQDQILPGSDICDVVKYLGKLQGVAECLTQKVSDARYIQVTVNGQRIDRLELVQETFSDGSKCYSVNVVLEKQ